MKLSKLSKILVSIYLVLTGICVIFALTGSDYKGRFVFLQLPIALPMPLQFDLLELFGISPKIMQDSIFNSWIFCYLFYSSLTIIFLIIIGEMIASIDPDK